MKFVSARRRRNVAQSREAGLSNRHAGRARYPGSRSNTATLIERSLFSDAVFFALFRDLVSHLSGRVERVPGPIMFADRARRGRLLRGGGGDWGGRCLLVVTFLHEEKAAENDGDKDNDKGSHAPNHSRL